MFERLKKKVCGRLEGRMVKTISKVGRTTLLKSMVQAIPSYAMSNFHLPTTFYQSLDKAARKFFWTEKVIEERYRAMTCWNKVFQPKDRGGLGIQKFDDINSTMMAKLGWHMATNSELLWVSLLQRKYCRDSNFLHMENKRGDSSG